MKKYKIRITDLAEQDFEEIGDYIAYHLEAPSTAVKIVKGIKKELISLASMPERNQLDEDKFLSELGVRRHYYKSYNIYYMVYEQENSIVILRILHTLVDRQAKIYRVFGR